MVDGAGKETSSSQMWVSNTWQFLHFGSAVFLQCSRLTQQVNLIGLDADGKIQERKQTNIDTSADIFIYLHVTRGRTYSRQDILKNFLPLNGISALKLYT